ncbi:MAG: protein phosphatase 2C domain-containing protein [Chloroflexota bacterium]|nr:protein phosphatase 2C domain-containing protein [Chloroflexota bacterium]
MTNDQESPNDKREVSATMVNFSTIFQIAAGTTAGTSHYHARQNRQDAWWVERTPHSISAIVCDGCGDPCSPYSEVGAALGCRLLAHRMCKLVDAGVPLDEAVEQTRLDTLAHLRVLAQSMGDLEDVVRHYFLFTAVGALITKQEAIFFSIGDGLVAVNDRLHMIGPYPDNAPPYLAYALLPCHGAEARRFKVHARVPTSELDRFLLGTDGAAPLLEKSLTVPGKEEAAGGLDHWWREDLYYHNSAALSNRLRLLSTDRHRIDWQARRKITDWGRLEDDVTLIVGRRVPLEELADGNE